MASDGIPPLEVRPSLGAATGCVKRRRHGRRRPRLGRVTDPSALAARLRAAAADLAALEPAVVEAGPWQLEPVFDTSDEARWGPPEILAHVDEMLPYWLGETARILDVPSTDDRAPAFGRVAADEVRLAIMGRDRTLPLGELFRRAADDADRAADRIAALSSGDLERAGRHPMRGEMRVGDLLDRFVVNHLEEHVRQLREALEASGRLPSA